MSLESYDAAIVGAGPGGSSCAWRLGLAGAKVLVLDKQAFPRNKPCAGWITPQVIQALQLDVDDYRQGQRVWQPISGFRSGLIGGREVQVVYPRPVSYGIRRCQFDTYLLERAGVSRLVQQPLQTITRQAGRWVINERFAAPIVVGAGGHFCPVARRLGARRNPRASVVVAQEVEYPAEVDDQGPGGVSGQIPEIYFCPDLQGYGWCFRKGGYLNIGLGRVDPSGLTRHVSQFCEFLRRRGKLRGEIPVAWAGHAYQLYHRVQPMLYDEGVLLVGDAAGLAYAASGEGIRPAVESGIIAAEVILAAGGSTAEQLAPYEDHIMKRFGPPRRSGAAGWLPAAWLHHVAARLLANRWFIRRVVMDGWFLHRHQSALMTAPVRVDSGEPFCQL